MRHVVCLLLLLIPLASASEIAGFAPGNDQAMNGLALAEEADRRGQGYGDTQSAMRMTLFNKRGDSVTRSMRSKTLEMPDAGDRTLLFFLDPADVRGTAFLTHSFEDRDDDQWLYLPALKRVKRIASSQRDGAFMSSEFSYEDLGADEVAKYTYRYLGETTIDGEPAYTLERTPVARSGYSKHVVTMDQSELRARKVEYFDRTGTLLKTLTASNYQRYLDQYWRPLRMEMVNHQNGKRTVLEWENYEFGAGLPMRDFERNALRDIR
ncbi:MAG: outer membrane lipoprotein-sorting protein [Pseudomonadota bacterium]